MGGILSAEEESGSVKAFWQALHTGNMRGVVPGACCKSSTRLTKELLVADEQNRECVRTRPNRETTDNKVCMKKQGMRGRRAIALARRSAQGARYSAHICKNCGAPLYIEQAELVLAQPLPRGMLVP